ISGKMPGYSRNQPVRPGESTRVDFDDQYGKLTIKTRTAQYRFENIDVALQRIIDDQVSRANGKISFEQKRTLLAGQTLTEVKRQLSYMLEQIPAYKLTGDSAPAPLPAGRRGNGNHYRRY
ncbi:MAG: hypothetical protein ACRD3W_04845, partial [Terriglobales bacterium]